MIGGELERLLRQLVREEVRAAIAEVGTAAAPAGAPGEYVSVATYAAARSISTSTVRQAIREGRLPRKRIGSRAVRVPRDVEIAPASSAESKPNATARAERRLGVLRGGRP